jgi:membrane protein DedA with SNARE-associated domain
MLESLIDTYGYVAVLVGTFVEDETVLVLGGFAAHRGYLVLPWVIMAAFLGTLCGDQLFFFLGRKHSQTVLARRPSWKARADRAQRLLERFRTPLILVFRFMYGLVIPFAVGMSTIPTREFIFLNIIGALVWTLVVGTGGYLSAMPWRSLLGTSNTMNGRY